MPEYSHGHAHEPVVASPISVPFVILASLLIGGGIFSLDYWLITQNWLWFLGWAPLLAGGLMLFSPKAGVNRAS